MAGGFLANLPPDMIDSLTHPGRRGSLDDVEHVVVLMQENRSFDHYYGTLAGVRGYGDPAVLDGVFAQPNPKGGQVLPFHVDTHSVDGQQLADLDHSWDGTHAAWAGGAYNNWIAAKTELTMSHFTESDIPFQHALADSFTICDHYFCSLQGPTTPNRLYLFTGMIDPMGTAGGPVTSNPDSYKPVYNWTTYPERLQAAGVSWQVYNNREVGEGDGPDGFLGDYGDNPLWLFHAYHDALASPDPAHRRLAERGGVHGSWLPSSGRGRDVDYVLTDFVNDCRAGTLPQVSYIVAPYGYCEHPRARPVDGAAYVHTVLRALFDNPKLWESTALFLNYDENDGFFDHVPPPVPAPGTPLEYVAGRPIGLGPRVPMTVVSPWSRGGWVNSEVHDHTSVIRFVERWTGVREPNISEWRRAVTGDLTSAFDFREHDTVIPLLPDTAALRRAVDQLQPSLPPPAPPGPDARRMPTQQPGQRPTRPLPYQPVANATRTGSGITLRLANHGARPAPLAVYAGAAPSQHLVAPGATESVGVPLSAGYDVSVHGPNGFLSRFLGTATDPEPDVSLTLTGDNAAPTLQLDISNPGPAPVQFRLANALGATRTITIAAGTTSTQRLNPLRDTHGWYDLTCTSDGDPTFLRRFAGHLETPAPSLSRPPTTQA
jgi:phospholipase C